MRILLISDIHSNIEAFRAVLDHTPFDKVLSIGDIVDYGPNPAEVFDLLQELAPKRVLGNHDVAATFRVDCRSTPSMHEASQVTRERITWKLLPEESLEILGKAEFIQSLDYDGLKVRTLHAAPGNPLYRYLMKEEAENLDINDADLLLVGHTHIAYEAKNERVWVVNPGSVGMPGDGDNRASYAILDTDARGSPSKGHNMTLKRWLQNLRVSCRERTRFSTFWSGRSTSLKGKRWIILVYINGVANVHVFARVDNLIPPVKPLIYTYSPNHHETARDSTQPAASPASDTCSHHTYIKIKYAKVG